MNSFDEGACGDIGYYQRDYMVCHFSSKYGVLKRQLRCSVRYRDPQDSSADARDVMQRILEAVATANGLLC